VLVVRFLNVFFYKAKCLSNVISTFFEPAYLLVEISNVIVNRGHIRLRDLVDY